jgi:putative hydrolase of the HAD superfamily
MEPLTVALQKIAPHVSATQFVSYWFSRDSRLAAPLLAELAFIRAAGTKVYLATNQEHLRAAYLMDQLGLAAHVDGIFYSAALGAKKPDAEFFTKVEASVEASPDELLLIDDSLQNIQAAFDAGWHAFHWTPHRTPGIIRNWCA